jgi:hypothetical protein
MVLNGCFDGVKVVEDLYVLPSVNNVEFWV